MGNISFNVKQILKKARKQAATQQDIRSCFSKEEQKHILKTGWAEGKIIIFVDSPAALYEYTLRKEEIKIRLAEKNIPATDVILKIGS